ncbi:hypothetical protein AB1460_26615, partial [Parafrankia sp. FMc2]
MGAVRRHLMPAGVTLVTLVVTVVLVRRYDWEPAGTMLTVITPALTVALLAYGALLVFPGRSASPETPAPGPPRRVDGPPVGALPARNRLFTGRAGQLDEIRRQLRAGPVAVTALHGMGGVGKTQLALEYTHRHLGDYTLIWWIDAEQSTLLAEKIAALAGPLGLPTGPVIETASAVLAALARRPGWLVVFDNAEHPTALAPWLPTGPGHVLITSRNPAWEHLAATVDVDLLPRPESVALLTRQLPALDPDTAGALAGELGDLPLALAQAGAYLAHTRTPPTRLPHPVPGPPRRVSGHRRPPALRRAPRHLLVAVPAPASHRRTRGGLAAPSLRAARPRPHPLHAHHAGHARTTSESSGLSRNTKKK